MTRPVARKVSRLRWLVRLYTFCEGLAALVIVLGAAFWISLGVDWLLEPSPAVRVLMWAAVLLAAGATVYRMVVIRTFASLSDESLALLMERRYPEFHESLITTVESYGARSDQSFEPALVLETGKQAATIARRAPLWAVFRARPLVRKAVLAALLVASIAAFALMGRETFGFWTQRMQLSPELWPRRVALTVAGFAEVDGVRTEKVARDDDFELQVAASIVDDHQSPATVEIRYRLADGRRGRDVMTRVGEALPGRDEAQRFRYRFKNVVADLSFDVLGGDDRIRNLKLQAVGRPTILKTTLACTYPTYLNQAPRTLEVSGRAELPAGTSAVCQVEVNKPLREVRVFELASQADLPAVISSAAASRFEFALEDLRQDQILMLSMTDADGVENREPYRLVVSVIPDEAPDVSVQLRGIGAAVTAQATIPIAGQITDDHGVEEVWFEYQIDQAPPEIRQLAEQPEGQIEIGQFERFDLAAADPVTSRPLVDVEPGQKLTLLLRARDAFDLQPAPQVGSSQRFQLEIVTPSQLRALLERQELGLRQRFEAIYEKMVGTRELLDRVASTEEEESAEEGGAAGAERRRERTRSRITGARQNTTQLSFETLGVADGFEQIVAELMNNRVATEELKQRLEQGIAEPLRIIGEQLMPALESSLEDLKLAHEEAPNEIGPALSASKTRADAVVEAMKEALDRMLELESYNELVELLRRIVEEQEKLNQRTKGEQKARLLDLLEQ